MKKFTRTIICLTLAFSSILYTACSNSKSNNKTNDLTYKDGQYEAKSDISDEHGGYGIIKINVKSGKITEVQFDVYQKDGKIKDETYARDQNDGLYKIAQNSIKAIDQLEQQLIEKQNIDGIDTASGATWNSNLFRNAARIALSEASGKDLTLNEDESDLNEVISENE